MGCQLRLAHRPELDEIPQLLFEKVASAVDSRFDRPGRKAENLGNLVIALLFQITKNKGCAIFLRQARDGPRHCRPSLVGNQGRNRLDLPFICELDLDLFTLIVR